MSSTTARIYQRPVNPMQSGKANGDDWILEYVPADRQNHDPLTGWYGSSDTRRQVKLRFDSKDEALTYAERMGLAVHVQPPRIHRLKIQAYSDNFR